jgi:hypothetical protein
MATQFRLAEWHCANLLAELPRWTSSGLTELEAPTATDGSAVDSLAFTLNNVPRGTVTHALLL